MSINPYIGELLHGCLLDHIVCFRGRLRRPDDNSAISGLGWKHHGVIAAEDPSDNRCFQICANVIAQGAQQRCLWLTVVTVGEDFLSNCTALITSAGLASVTAHYYPALNQILRQIRAFDVDVELLPVLLINCTAF